MNEAEGSGFLSPECAMLHCTERARWQPIMKLRPLGYIGDPAELTVDLGFCPTHKTEFADLAMTRDFDHWAQVFIKLGKAAPHPINSWVDWMEIHIPEAS